MRYCKAYTLMQFADFPAWTDLAGQAERTGPEVGYLWPDFTVTLSPFPWKKVFLVSAPTPEWEIFCAKDLGFVVPKDSAEYDSSVP